MITLKKVNLRDKKSPGEGLLDGVKVAALI